MACVHTPQPHDLAYLMDGDRIRKLGEAIDAFLDLDDSQMTQDGERVLEDREELREFLAPMVEHATQSPGTGETSPLIAESGPRLDGRVLGDFRLEHLIGRGGMGVVYEAIQISLGRRVAVKILPATFALLASRTERFRREAQAAARLRHPNLVAIYTIGDDAGLAYFAMELITGESLSSRIRERAGLPRTPSEFDSLARLAQQVADALAYAHEQGVIHRDIKPSNILLEPDGTPRVTDFGLAKLVDASTEPSSDVSYTGEVLGTPFYMSPEQAAGDKDLDGRSDVYALGVTLYELLCGHPPFHDGSIQTVLSRIQEEEIPDPQRLNPNIPTDLATIVTKAARCEPSQRYTTAADLAADLRRYLNREPILARPMSWTYRLLRLSQRHKGLSAATITLLVAGSILAWTLRDRADLQERADELKDVSQRMDALSRVLIASQSGGAPDPTDLAEAAEVLGEKNLELARTAPAVLAAQFRERLQALRGASENEGPRLVGPKFNVLSGRPVFRFRLPELERPGEAMLELLPLTDPIDFSAKIRLPVKQTEPGVTQFELPEDLALEPGDYAWYLTPSDSLSQRAPDVSSGDQLFFKVLASDEIPSEPVMVGEANTPVHRWLAHISRLIDIEAYEAAVEMLDRVPEDATEDHRELARRLEIVARLELGDQALLEELTENR